jgi:hypothetical protein
MPPDHDSIASDDRSPRQLPRKHSVQLPAQSYILRRGHNHGACAPLIAITQSFAKYCQSTIDVGAATSLDSNGQHSGHGRPAFAGGVKMRSHRFRKQLNAWTQQHKLPMPPEPPGGITSTLSPEGSHRPEHRVFRLRILLLLLSLLL